MNKILLVEDDELDADMTLRSLKELPLDNDIIWLETGKELLDYLNEHGTAGITLVILDLKMPLMSGLEALEIIKSDEEPIYDYFPIVMMTSSRNQREINRCYELGVNAFISKPVDQKEFQEAVKALGLFWGILNLLPHPNSDNQ